jgi:hypothetical protein
MKLHETVEMVKWPALAMAGIAFLGEVGTLYSGALGAMAFFIMILVVLYSGYHAVRRYYADLVPAGAMGALVGIIGALSGSAAHSLSILAIRMMAPCEACASYGIYGAAADFIVFGASAALFWAAIGFILGLAGAVLAARGMERPGL